MSGASWLERAAGLTTGAPLGKAKPLFPKVKPVDFYAALRAEGVPIDENGKLITVEDSDAAKAR